MDYHRFLRRFDVAVNKEKWVGWKTILMKDAYEALYCAVAIRVPPGPDLLESGRDADLKATLALFDPEHTGRVSVQNFLKVLQSEVCVVPQQRGNGAHVIGCCVPARELHSARM